MQQPEGKRKWYQIYTGTKKKWYNIFFFTTKLQARSYHTGIQKGCFCRNTYVVCL